MFSFKDFFALSLLITILFGCSGLSLGGTKVTPTKTIKVETPNCPTSECKFSYENSDRNDYVFPPGSVELPESNSTLYAICYERTGGYQERITVPTTTTTLLHPLNCIQLEENIINDAKKTENLEEITEIKDTDNFKDSKITSKNGGDLESEGAINEYDQKLLDQLLELLDQGLISSSAFEKEKQNIINKQGD